MKRVILLFLFLTMVCATFAQELTVKSFEVKPMDLSASISPRLDLNKQPCALVKVQLAAVGAQFSGNVIGDCEYKAGEYWVYMSQGSYQLVIRHPNFVPLTVNFRDYDIRGVESKTTYVLTLLMPQTGQVVDEGIRYLTMTVEPKTAMVMVDDEVRTLADGILKLRLPQGTHSYAVMAEGYDPERGTVMLDEGTKRVTVTLKSVMAELQVQCATAGAEVYIDGDLKGKAPWRGSLAAKNYEVELRLAGHRSNRQSISLQKSEQRTLDVPALQALTGALDVNYDPVDAEVWLDGKKLGTSPDIFRNVLIGRHEVELRASGYTSKKETVEVKEGQTVSLAGQLQQSAGLTTTSGSMENGHEWVDLGLSVCWATMNVGASTPGDYGDYFAWGETVVKEVYNWGNYRMCKSDAKKQTKYCTKSEYGKIDNKTVLDTSDDVAHISWGGNWRMPTLEELKELKEKCTWTWTTQNDHDGYKVTGPNGNTIFLPAAGYRDNSSLHNAGSLGHFWSRMLNVSYPDAAWYLGFTSSDLRTSSYSRYYAFTVRPVRLSE